MTDAELVIVHFSPFFNYSVLLNYVIDTFCIPLISSAGVKFELQF